jgi:hypothetical protein
MNGKLSILSLMVLSAAVAHAGSLPEFFSSDPEHDRLLNDLYRRHSRMDVSDTSLRQATGAVVPGIGTCMLWRDYEIDQFAWHDASQAVYPHEDRWGGLRGMLETIPVDTFGYVFTAHDGSPPPTTGPHTFFGMGWPFPEYPLALGSLAAGWEWTGDDTQGWTAENAESSEVEDGFWRVTSATGALHLVSSEIAAKSFHAPFVLVDLACEDIDESAPPADRAFTLCWTTEEEPAFSPERSVRSDTWPVVPVEAMEKGFGRRVWFPMHLHPEWDGKTITRIRIDLPGPSAIRLNNVRLNYDTRHAINNPVFIRACARKFFWDSDTEWLKVMLPRMRMAAEFVLTHLKGRELGFPDQTFFVGHDGLGWETPEERRVGHGIGTNYYDLLPMGPRGIQSSIMWCQALEAMAKVEAHVEAHPDLDSPKPGVRGPDGKGRVPYTETADSLARLAEESRRAVSRAFWNPETGRFAGWRDVNGVLKDYGYTHFNAEALEAGIATPEQARQVLDWLDGRRIVDGDTSTGDDIYRWEFAARMSTRRNVTDYFWGWQGSNIAWGDQVQDGGGVLFTTFYDVKGRLHYGDTEGAWRVWRRMLDHHTKVLANGGTGNRFYRDYYESDPSRGNLQGGGTAGGLGLDEEFVENLLVPTAWATAWVGLSAPEPGVLEIAPTVPDALGHAGLRGAAYRGNRIDVRAEPGVIDLTGSDIADASAGRLRLVFRGVSSGHLHRNGTDTGAEGRPTDRGLEFETPLEAARFEVHPARP